MKRAFKIGDRVVLTKKHDGAFPGLKGVVVISANDETDGDVGVKFGPKFEGHSLESYEGVEDRSQGHGWWVPVEKLRLDRSKKSKSSLRKKKAK